VLNIDIEKKMSEHETEKPITLYKTLLKYSARPNAKIFDPFLGSGSIAIACYDLGFDLTGCEIDKDYYNSAVNRFKNHISQGNIFQNEKQHIFQNETSFKLTKKE